MASSAPTNKRGVDDCPHRLRTGGRPPTHARSGLQLSPRQASQFAHTSRPPNNPDEVATGCDMRAAVLPLVTVVLLGFISARIGEPEGTNICFSTLTSGRGGPRARSFFFPTARAVGHLPCPLYPDEKQPPDSLEFFLCLASLWVLSG